MAMLDRYRFNRFTSSGFDPRERFDAYMDRSFTRLYDTSLDTPFYVHSESVQIGRILLVYTNIAGQRWARDDQRVRKSFDDGFGVNASIDITAKGVFEDRSFHQGLGQVVMTDLSKTSAHESTDGRSIHLVMPRDVATAAGLNVSELHGVVLQSAAAQMFTSYLLSLHTTIEGMSVGEGSRLERTILDILALAIGASASGSKFLPGMSAGNSFDRAQREIQQNLGSSLLTATNLCRRLNISRSTLHRIFEDDGGVQAYIRNQRLDAAKLALRPPAIGSRIVDVAERFGFSDAAHFTRLFRERFGETPSAYRSSRDENSKMEI